jgi:hypothetical protein
MLDVSVDGHDGITPRLKDASEDAEPTVRPELLSSL